MVKTIRVLSVQLAEACAEALIYIHGSYVHRGKQTHKYVANKILRTSIFYRFEILQQRSCPVALTT